MTIASFFQRTNRSQRFIQSLQFYF